MDKNKLKYGFCLGIIIVLLALSMVIKNEMYGNLLASLSIIIGSVTFHQLRTKNFKNYE
jgi:hypothetical protein